MTDVPKGCTHASLSIIFQSKDYSDLIIRCGERVFKVHRAIVCSRSKFFAAACDGRFQESINQEIFLEDDDPDTVDRMLTYLYKSDYCDGDNSRPTSPEEVSDDVVEGEEIEDEEFEDEDVPVSASQYTTEEQSDTLATANEPSLLNNVLVYTIAEKYDIAELKELAKAKFQRRAERLLSANEFPEIIRELYRSTPSSDRGLRDIVSQICAQQGRTIIDRPDLNAVIVEIGEFGLDLLREVLNYENKRTEEVLSKNTALKNQLNKKKEEISEFQRRVGSVSKVLKKVAKDVEEGKVSGGFYY